MILNSLHTKLTFILSVFSFIMLGYGQSLDDYIKIAHDNNPRIKAFEKKHNLISEKVNEVSIYPNTQLSAGLFTSEPKTRNGAQNFKASIKQMLPQFGLISAKKNYIKSLASEKEQDIIIAKREIASSVATTYYKLYALQAKQSVLDQHIQLLNTFETLLLSAIQSGKSAVVNVFRLQMQRNEISAKKEVFQHQFSGYQSVMNNILNRNANELVVVTDSLNVPDNEELINQKGLVVHPELIKYDKLYDAVAKSELVNQKENNTMFGFGLDYVTVRKRPGMEFNHNGKDIFMPMMSLSIPLFNKKYKSVTIQNKLQQDIIKEEREERLNNLQAKLNQALANRKAALANYKAQVENLKKAKEAEQLLTNSYQTNMVDFNDILKVQELQLKYEVNRIEAIKNYYIQSTLINYLTQ